MNILLVAQDIGGCTGLQALNEELARRGHQASDFLAFGQLGRLPTRNSIEYVSQHSDLLVTGRSSSPQLATEELAAIKAAKDAGVPYVIYADNFVVLPPWFEEAGKHASVIFVINEILAEQTQRKFPNTNVVASGNPSWETFSTPKQTRQNVRNTLGYRPNDIVILSPGTKIAAADIIMWGAIMEAICSSTGDLQQRQFHLLLARHPGDRTPQEIYDQFVIYSQKPIRFLNRNSMSASEALAGVDMVIESGGSIGVEAAHLRLPVITFLSELWLNVLERAKGNRIWEPAAYGATELVCGSSTGLGMAISFLLDPKSAAGQKIRQIESFPTPPTPGTAARIMADACLEVGKK